MGVNSALVDWYKRRLICSPIRYRTRGLASGDGFTPLSCPAFRHLGPMLVRHSRCGLTCFGLAATCRCLKTVRKTLNITQKGKLFMTPTHVPGTAVPCSVQVDKILLSEANAGLSIDSYGEILTLSIMTDDGKVVGISISNANLI